MRPLRISFRSLPLLLGAAALWSAGAAPGLASAAAKGHASASGKKPAPASYVLRNAKQHCRAHYTRRRTVVRRRRHGRMVKVRVIRCVASTPAAGHPPGAVPTFPAHLPTATVTLSILPTANNQGYSTVAGSTLSVGGPGVLAGASGGTLSASLVSAPATGQLALGRDGSFSYTPATGASGIVHFTYRVTSASGESSTPATVTIRVVPHAADSVFAVSAGGTLTIPAGRLLAGDVGSGLTAALVSEPADGSLSLAPDGSATYVPAGGFTGADRFSYQAVDGAAQHSNTAVVTVNVGALPPTLALEDFPGAIGNTELRVGGAPGTRPEVYLNRSGLLAGDTDPNGGTLSVEPGTVTTAQGGSVTIAADGTFSYEPPPGFAGPSDSFGYVVDASEGVSAAAIATIDFTGARVWYVDDANPGTPVPLGTSAAPFGSLAAVAAGAGHAGPGDVIHLAGGGAPYAGGIAPAADVSLVGSGAPLVVGGVTLAAASSPVAVVTNAGGAGITLAEGDTVAGLTVSGTSGDAITAAGVDSFSLASTVTVAGAGGDGLAIDGGSGTVSAAASIAGAAGHSVVIENRSGGSVALSGAIDDTAAGLLVQDDGGASVAFSGAITASTGAAPAFVATGGGTVTATSPSSSLATTAARALEVSGASAIGAGGLTFASISAAGAQNGILIDAPAGGGGLAVGTPGAAAGAGGTIQDTAGDAISITGAGSVTLSAMNLTAPGRDGVDATNVPQFAAADLDVSTPGADGIALAGDGSLGQGFVLNRNTISGAPGAGIRVSAATAGAGDASGAITANTITATGPGDGIDVSADHAGQLIVDLTANTLAGLAAGTGIDARSLGGADLELTLVGNGVTMSGSAAGDAVSVSEGGASTGTVCVDPRQNALASTGAGAYDIALAQLTPSGTFGLENYVAPASVTGFLAGANTLGANGPFADAAGNANGFTSGTCRTPLQQNG